MDCLLLALERMPTFTQRFYQGKPVPADNKRCPGRELLSHNTLCVLCWAKSLQLCLTLCDAIDYSPPGSSLSMGFSRQECWSELPCPPLGDLPNPETKAGFPALQADSLLSEPPRQPQNCINSKHTLKTNKQTKRSTKYPHQMRTLH